MSLLSKWIKRKEAPVAAKTEKTAAPAKKKNKYITLVSDATGWSRKKAKTEMDTVKKQLGISYKEYYEHAFYKKTRSRQERTANVINRKNKREAIILKKVRKRTGMNKKDILADVERMNQMNIYPVTLSDYSRYGLYELDEESLKKQLGLMAEIKEQTPVLERKFAKIDKGELTYEDIEEDYKAYMNLLTAAITPRLKRSLVQNIRRSHPEVVEDEADHDRIVADIQLSRILLHFPVQDYKMYHLYASDLAGKREYVSDYVRQKTIRRVNTQELFDLVNNKYSLYQKIAPFFKRDVVSIVSKADFPIFADYVKKHPTFVCKPLNDSLGRGVSLETVDLEGDLKEQFNALLADKRTFLMEERIKCHESMAAFNPDSLNTVRLIMYFDGENVTPVGSFFRTGRPGSFVDNAGAGGVFASVDYVHGVLNSCGADERGRLYEEHPDSHIRYEGFKIPNWDDALKVGEEAIRAIGFPCLVGWDLAYNENGEWVVVEGNGLPQFVHQSPLGYGVKSQLLKDLGLTA